MVTDWLDRQARATDTGRVEGFNFATTGYDIGQVVAVVTHGVEAWAPDLVVYGSYTNDVSPTRLLTDARFDPIFVSREVPPPVALIGPAADAWLVVRSAARRRLLGARYARFLDENLAGPTTSKATGRGSPPSAAGRRRPGPWWWSDSRPTSWPTPRAAPVLLQAPDRCALNQQRHAQTTAALQDAGLPWTDTLPALQATGEDAFYPDNRNDPTTPALPDTGSTRRPRCPCSRAPWACRARARTPAPCRRRPGRRRAAGTSPDPTGPDRGTYSDGEPSPSAPAAGASGARTGSS